MGLYDMQRTLRKVPVLYQTLKWSRDTVRSTLGPGWLRKQVAQRAARGEPIRIILGAGGVPADSGWIPTNIQFLNLLVNEQWKRAFGNTGIDAILAEHVWEHLTPANAKAAAAQCYKYLKPGGYLRIAVPDGNHPDPDYLEFTRPGGIPAGSAGHEVMYTYATMREMLQSVGFKPELLEYYDENHNFHESPWKQSDGHIGRCKGWKEKKPDGSVMHFTSLLVDARK